MDLVDRDRGAARVGVAPEGTMIGVAPVMVEPGRDDRGGLGPQLGLAGERVGLEGQAVAVRADQLELVGGADLRLGDEYLPDADGLAQPHDVAAAVPAVELAHDADAAGVGAQTAKCTPRRLVADGVGAHLIEEAQVAALADVIVVHRPEDRAEAVGVPDPPLAAFVARAVLQRLALADAQHALEEAAVVNLPQGPGRLVGEGEGLDLGRALDHAAGD